VSFVKAEDASGSAGDDRPKTKSDEQLEEDRREVRRRDEEASFRDVSIPIGCPSFSSNVLFYDKSSV
jgi:hypothetical protein